MQILYTKSIDKLIGKKFKFLDIVRQYYNNLFIEATSSKSLNIRLIIKCNTILKIYDNYIQKQ